jgi:hypothetical protein
MSGSGYVIETAAKPSQKSLTGWIGSLVNPAQQCKGSELLFPFYRKSFRSGSAWNRYGELEGARRQSDESTLLENIMSITGMDIGHEYELKQVTDIKSSFKTTGPVSGANRFALDGTFALPRASSTPSANTIYDYINFVGNGQTVTDATLIAQGTRCIAATNPLKPPVTLATSLTELVSEGLPSMLGRQIFKTPSNKKRALVSSVGGEYLNYVFGVLPILSDISGLVKILRQGTDIVEQWQRNDGRQVRRSRTWQGDYNRVRYDSDLFDSGNYYICGIFPDAATHVAAPTNRSQNISGGQSGFLESYMQEDIQYSFAGAFEYDVSRLIPDYPAPIKELIYGSSSDEDVAQVILEMHLAGLDPKTATSAETVWNVLPFSWLVDWFVNIGDLVSNVTAYQTAGLKLDYGYMSVKQNRRFTATFLQNHHGSTTSGTVSISSVRKRRIRATPYGFGSTFSSLSAGQSAILTSLATSKLK